MFRIYYGHDDDLAMYLNADTNMVDFRILFASEEEQQHFVLNGQRGLSGEALKNMLLARKFVLSLLSRSMGMSHFYEIFKNLEKHPLFSFPGCDMIDGVQSLEDRVKSNWGSDLVVVLGKPSDPKRGQALFFNLIPSLNWDLSCFEEGDVALLERLLEQINERAVQPYRLETVMSPFGLPAGEFKVAGCSWMLPLAIACQNAQQGFVMSSQVVFTGCLSTTGNVSVDSASLDGKWWACRQLGMQNLLTPHKIFGPNFEDMEVGTLAKALQVNESINIFSIEGKTDRQVVSVLRKSSLTKRNWKNTLPIAQKFCDKLVAAGVQKSHPATFDYAQRLLASSLLHTGQAEEAYVIINNILENLHDKDVSTYLHLDIFEKGDEWLRYAFDYFFTESTVLSKLGLINEGIKAIDERLKGLEKTTVLMKQAFGLKTSQRLDYTWVKGIFTKVICLIERSVALYEVESLLEAWKLCQHQRYHKFFETFLGMPEEELPEYLSVEAVIRSFNYTVDVALELHGHDLLEPEELEDLNMRRHRILEHWGEQPHDLFFGISCLKLDNMCDKLNPSCKKRYREFFWNFRDSSFYAMADTVMERLNV